MTDKKPLIFTVANRKGGVGKTTNTVNLAYLYSQMGLKTLLIDADAQGSLTQTLGIDRSIGSSPELTINNITKVSKELREHQDEPYQIDDLFGNAPDSEMSPSSYVGLHDLLTKAFYGQPLSETDVKNAIVSPSYKLEKSKAELKKEETDSNSDVSINDLDAMMYNRYYFGFDLIPSSEELTDDELMFTLDSDESRKQIKGIIMTRVCQAISRYCDYDIILIDTGPSLGILTVNAMAAAVDGIIVSVSIDEQSLWSLQKFKFNIRQIKQMIPGHEGVLGVILAPYDSRSQLTPIISEKIKRVLNMYLFETKIPRSNSAAKAVASGVLFSMIHSDANHAYESLAKEILERHEENHKWEQERNKLALEEVNKLKQDVTYMRMRDDELLDIVREKYSNGELWSMPTSDYLIEEVKEVSDEDNRQESTE